MEEKPSNFAHVGGWEFGTSGHVNKEVSWEIHWSILGISEALSLGDRSFCEGHSRERENFHFANLLLWADVEKQHGAHRLPSRLNLGLNLLPRVCCMIFASNLTFLSLGLLICKIIIVMPVSVSLL